MLGNAVPLLSVWCFDHLGICLIAGSSRARYTEKSTDQHRAHDCDDPEALATEFALLPSSLTGQGKLFDVLSNHSLTL